MLTEAAKMCEKNHFSVMKLWRKIHVKVLVGLCSLPPITKVDYIVCGGGGG